MKRGIPRCYTILLHLAQGSGRGDSSSRVPSEKCRSLSQVTHSAQLLAQRREKFNNFGYEVSLLLFYYILFFFLSLVALAEADQLTSNGTAARRLKKQIKRDCHPKFTVNDTSILDRFARRCDIRGLSGKAHVQEEGKLMFGPM